jgi:FkbM family methyltransferase
LGAKRIILFEPIRETCDILLENLRINNLNSISDVSHLGIGLGDKASRASFSVDPANLGGTTLQETSSGSIRTETGDSVLSNQHVDFIKIDTEGFEIKVLLGLTETIQRCRPSIYIEVDNKNAHAFVEFVAKSNYRVELRHNHYGHNKNFFILPVKQ